MKTVQVKTNIGWRDYCDAGVVTNMYDADGNVLCTGDVVEVVEMRYGAEYADVVGVAMIVFDQHKRFITTDKFFAAGWLDHDWSDKSTIIRRVAYDQLPDDAHHKIVD